MERRPARTRTRAVEAPSRAALVAAGLSLLALLLIVVLIVPR
jgi:hypothetical protein